MNNPKNPAVKKPLAKKNAPKTLSKKEVKKASAKKAAKKLNTKLASSAAASAKRKENASTEVSRKDIEALAYQFYMTRQERHEYGCQDGDWQAACEQLGVNFKK